MKYLGPNNTVQSFEHNFTYFHKFKNGKNYSLKEVITCFNLSNCLNIINKTIQIKNFGEDLLNLLINIGVEFNGVEDKLYLKLNDNCFGYIKGSKEVEFDNLGEITKNKISKFYKISLTKKKFLIFSKFKYFNYVMDSDLFFYKKTDSIIQTNNNTFGQILFFISFKNTNNFDNYVMIKKYKTLGYLPHTNNAVLNYFPNKYKIIKISEIKRKCSILRINKFKKIINVSENPSIFNQKISTKKFL